MHAVWDNIPAISAPDIIIFSTFIKTMSGADIAALGAGAFFGMFL